MKISTIQIFGERRSGTNYLELLLKKNFLGVNITISKFGHKHWFLETCGSGAMCGKDRVKGFQKLSRSNKSDLFIVIYRNSYDWLRSMHVTPHHAPAHRNIPFKDFIRKEWVCYYGNYEKTNIYPENEMMCERDPNTGNRFGNILKLRTSKIMDFETLRNRVSNVIYIKYEDLIKNYDQILTDIAHKFGIEMSSKKITNIPNNGRPNGSKHHLTPEDIEFINEQLDWSVESSIVYHKRI